MSSWEGEERSVELIPRSSYKNDPQILAMTNLVSAYQRKEIWEYEKILKGKR